MKVITENDNNVGYEKITIVVDNMTLRDEILIINYWKKYKKIITIVTGIIVIVTYIQKVTSFIAKINRLS